MLKISANRKESTEPPPDADLAHRKSMIGLGSELQVSADDRRVRIENLSVGDEVYNHLTGSLNEIEDMFVQTVKLDNESPVSKQIVVYESSVGGLNLANRWNIVSRDLIITSLLNRFQPRMPTMADNLSTYFDVFKGEYLVQYELWFSRPVFASVGGMICLFGPAVRQSSPSQDFPNSGMTCSIKLSRSARRNQGDGT